MSSRSQGTKNRHPSRKQRSGRKRGASDAKAPVPGPSGNGHAAPTPAQFGARAPLAGKAIAPEVPPLSLRGQFLAPEMRQAKISRVKARPATAARVDSPPPQPGQPPKILSAVIRPTSALGTALSVGFSMGWNGPPLLEVANDDMVDIRASQPQPIDYSVIATAEATEAAVADTQAEPAAPYLHTEAGDTTSPALPLPRHAEPLAAPKPVATRPDTRDPSKPLPRHLAPAKPSEGLWGAMGQWLRSAGQLLASGFMVKKTRPRTPSPATMREATELTQLRAENRRLRMQLGDMMQAQRAPTRTMDQRMMDQVPG